MRRCFRQNVTQAFHLTRIFLGGPRISKRCSLRACAIFCRRAFITMNRGPSDFDFWNPLWVWSLLLVNDSVLRKSQCFQERCFAWWKQLWNVLESVISRVWKEWWFVYIFMSADFFGLLFLFDTCIVNYYFSIWVFTLFHKYLSKNSKIKTRI